MSAPRPGLPRLMVVTNRRATGGRPLGEVVEAALEGGARMIQLREKDLDGGPLLELARDLRERTRRHHARLLVNDRIDVALAAEADGVVLPAVSFTTADARARIGPDRLLGRSTHSAEEVRAAEREGADFAIFGPVFATPSKAAYGSPQGVAALAAAARASIPVFAVGGIEDSAVTEILAAGAHGIAVIRAVLAADSPASAARSLAARCETTVLTPERGSDSF